MLADRYKWEGHLSDGRVRCEGENLKGVAVVTLTPSNSSVPPHSFSGLTFVRRFCRGFMHGLGGGLREYVHCFVAEECRVYVKSSDGAVIVTPPDYELYL